MGPPQTFRQQHNRTCPNFHRFAADYKQIPFLKNLVTRDESWLLFKNVKRQKFWVSPGVSTKGIPKGVHCKKAIFELAFCWLILCQKVRWDREMTVLHSNLSQSGRAQIWRIWIWFSIRIFINWKRRLFLWKKLNKYANFEVAIIMHQPNSSSVFFFYFLTFYLILFWLYKIQFFILFCFYFAIR